MMSKKLRAEILFIFTLFCLSSCNRFKKKEEKPPKEFEVFVPLADDYALLSKGIIEEIESSFPKSKITVIEGLSDKYEIAPFDDWLTKANPSAFVKLQIKTDRPEELAHITAFLNEEESKIPFKVKIPKLELEGSESRGQALFCRMKTEGNDLFERQTCHEIINALCGKEMPKKTIPNPPLCSLRLDLPTTVQASTARPREFYLTGFPLPVRVRGEYPFMRYGETDDAVLLSLF